jgi:hypothetical protein
MFLPIGDAPNPKGVPIVTYALIAANVAAFLLLNVPLDSRRATCQSRRSSRSMKPSERVQRKISPP